jgi:predicted metal-dependent hydrolase
MSAENTSNISYTLKRFKKSKSLKLKIRRDGEILVTAPSRLSKIHIDAFVSEQAPWIIEKLHYLNSLPQPNIKVQKEDYKRYKERARSLVKKHILKLNEHYKFSFNSVSIRDQKTRWGSCSSKKNLSFSYKIALIPEIFVEYIVAHELCHLQEMNHGPQFWNLVAQTIPEYKRIQEELRGFHI